MARFPRVVVVDVPHHVTQRGNAQQGILATDTDRRTYMALLREYAQLYRLSLLGYCLMSNHVHLIHCCSAHRCGPFTISETGARTVCVLLERATVLDRARVARVVLFVPAG